MQCNVSTQSLWREGQNYVVTIKLYNLSGTARYTQTTVNVAGQNVRLVEFVDPVNPTPEPYNVQSGTPGSQLSWVGTFNGGPVPLAPWTLKFTCTGAPGIYGTDRATIKVFGSSFYADTISAEDPFDDELRVTLADANGVIAIPPTPKKLKAKALGAVAIELKWARVDYASTIKIERSDTDDFSGTVWEWEVGGSKTTWLDFKTSGLEPTVADLSPDTEYWYRITGINSMGESSASDIISATTIANPAAPSAPTGVRAGKTSGTEITLGFEPISSLVVQTDDGKVTLEPTYQASYSTVDGGPYTAFDVYDTDKNIKVTGLSPNTDYYFVVRSSYLYAPAVVSSNSVQASGRTGNITGTPAAPTSFAGTVSNFTTITLTWVDTNDGEATWTIWRAAGAATNPYVLVVSNLPGDTVEYVDSGLAASTQYFYRIRGTNNVGPGATATTDATTQALPAAPDAPDTPVATPTSDTTIALDITTAITGTDPDFLEIRRANITGGPYTTIGEIAVPSPYNGVTIHFVDDNDLADNATYFYVARGKNAGGAGALSGEASATTFRRSSTESDVSAFTLSPGSAVDIIQIGTRAVVISDMDRMVVYTNRAWFRGGIKRQLNAPVLAAVGGGALAADTYTVFTVLYSSKRSTRSLPSDGADIVVTAGQTIRITPDLAGGSPNIVLVRDTAYDSANNPIYAADYVEFYIASSTSANAYLVATVPVNDPIWDSVGYYELPSTLTTQAIFGSERRPMEILGESSLPPACAHGYAKDNRLILFGEKTFTPTQEETAAGALVTINTGDTTFTTTNYDLNDGMIYHELYLNGNPTGWEIYDIDEATNTAYIRNADQDINEQGYRGLGGSFSDFNMAARASRVYYSAFFTGEANGATTFSPETFPPLTHFEAEFFPQDNTDPNAIITSNADLIVGKPSKMMLVRGGGEPDFPLIQVISLSQSSGLNAPGTICRDSRDNVYYLGDSGPFAVSSSGVQKLNVQSGNQNLFQQIFDINSVAGAQGTWYSQQDWMVVAGLNRRGRGGFKDGFIYDPLLELLCPFSTPYQITWLEEVKNIFGQYQIMFGDSEGRLGILFKPGLSADGIDYSIAAPSIFATPISGYMRGPVMQTQNRITVRSFQPQIFMQNGATARCKFSVARKDRMDDPYAFNPQKVVEFDTDDTRTYFSVASHSYPNAVVQFDFTLPVNPTNARMSWREIVLELVNRGPL